MLSFNFSPFPQLETPRLLLKQILPADAPALFEMRSDENVMRYIDRPLAKTEADALALILSVTELLQKNEAITWGIFEKDRTALKGTIGFWRVQPEHHRAEIGYLLHPLLQGRGLMQEALQAVLNYGFTTMNLHSVEANVNPENERSKKILERNGFVQEAHFRENYFYDGVFKDSLIYSLLTPYRKTSASATEVQSAGTGRVQA